MSLLLDQPFLVAPFAAYVVAQVGKFGLRDFHGERDLPYLYRSGGMPSAHSAVVMALATTVGVADGVYSTTFAIALWLAGIVIYDAMGVRRTTGEQTVAIKQLQEHVKLPAKERLHHMHNAKGHTPRQIIIGALLGLIVGLCFTPHFWGVHVSWLAMPLSIEELAFMGVIYGLILMNAIVFYMLFMRHLGITPKMRKAMTYGFLLPMTGGLLVSVLGVGEWVSSVMRLYSLLPLAVASGLTFLAASHISMERAKGKQKLV